MAQDREQGQSQAQDDTTHAPSKNYTSSVSIFSSKIRCGDCGGFYGSKVWHSNDKYRKVIWQCNHKFKRKGEVDGHADGVVDGHNADVHAAGRADGVVDGRANGCVKCTTPHLDEDTIKRIFIDALNIIAKDRKGIIEAFEAIRDTAFSTEALEAEIEALTGELSTVDKLIKKCIAKNARVAQDQEKYAKRYDALVQRDERARRRLDEAKAAIIKTRAQRQMMENFMEVLKNLPEQIEVFDEDTWYALCDYITVYGKGDYLVKFRDGTELKI